MKKILFASSILFTFISCLSASNQQANTLIEKFVRLHMLDKWEEIATIMHPESLASIKKDFIKRLKKAKTLDEEKEMLRNVGYPSIEEIKSSSDKQVYIKLNKAISKVIAFQKNLDENALKSLSLKFICSNNEDENTYFGFLRRKFTNKGVKYSDIQIVGLKKYKGKWLVSPLSLEPTVTK